MGQRAQSARAVVDQFEEARTYLKIEIGVELS
jgi:hypothetical protein